MGRAVELVRSALNGRLARQSGGVVVVRLVGMVLLFAQTVALARLLGVTDYGSYAWALGWGTIARLVVTLGLDWIAVRETAVYADQGRVGEVRGLWLRGSQAVGLVCAVVVPVILIAGSLTAADGTAQFVALAVGVAWLPLIGEMALMNAIVLGLSRPVAARVTEDVVFPVCFLVALLAVFALAPDVRSPTAAMGLRVGAVALACAVAFAQVHRALSPLGRRTALRFDTRRWFSGSLPLVLIAGANVFILEFGTIVVGSVEGSSAAGPYSVALRIAFLLTVTEFAANAALGPVIARLHAAGELAEVQSKLTRAATGVFLVSALGAAVIVAVPGPLLSVFGAGFDVAAGSLRVLALGWMLNLMAGFCGLALVMTHDEASAAVGLLCGAVVSLPLTIVLVGALGPVGASASAAACMVVWNVILVRRCWRAHGLDPTAFGLLVRLRGRPMARPA